MRQRIIANNNNIKYIVNQEILKYGLNADLNHIDVSQVTNMSDLFNNSNTFNPFYSLYVVDKFNGDISKWDVSNVTDMSYMFHQSCFNGDISKWDMSNVTNTKYMFFESHFNQDISNWNLSQIKNATCMFNITNFSNFEHFKSFIRKNKKLLLHLVYFPRDFNLLKNKNSFILFQSFLTQEYNYLSENNFDISIFYHFNTLYPFLSCQTFNKIDAEIYKIKLIHYFKSLPDNSANYPIHKFFKFILYFHNAESFFIDNKSCLLIQLNNFDFLLCLFLLKIDFETLVTHHFFLKKFFENIILMFEKLEELICFSNQIIKDLPLVQFVIDEFFKFEKYLIQQQNKTYLDYLNKHKNMFSHFYPYYSFEQKQELFASKNKLDCKLFDSETIFI